MATHTWPSRASVVMTAVLALLQAWWAWGADGDAASTSAVLAPISLVAAVALARVNCLETRLPVVVVAFAQLGLIGLALLLGLPGQPRHELDAQAVAALVVPLAILVLIDLDRHARRARRAGSPAPEQSSPYAR
jgi:hypothetical protein